MPSPVNFDHWPYPRWIAHRGAGTLAPENTLAAFRLGWAHGLRMAECDVKLSADGVPYLLHDATLERTSSGQGPASALPWAALAQLDAGSWHSPAFAGEPLPSLANVAGWCQAHGMALNIEIKPNPGQDTDTGHVVAQVAARLWAEAHTPPLLSSFSEIALAAAQQAAPQLPRALLLDRWPDDALDTAQGLGCVALVAHHSLWTQARVRAAHALGLRTLSYTVNDLAVAKQLLGWGMDGLITDAVDLLPAALQC